jgi:hypothetical protein
MNLKLSTLSILFFLLSLLFLLLLTRFESSLTGLSLTAERILSLLLLVVPALAGIVFGVLSILRKESRRWLGVLGTLLNALFALFHLFLLSFAG